MARTHRDNRYSSHTGEASQMLWPWIARFSPYLLGAATLVLSTGGSLAEKGAKNPTEVVFLAELLVLMLVGRLLGEAMNRIGQPSVMGQLLAGILLGPSFLGWLWPDLQHWVFPTGKEQKLMID